MIGRLGCSPVSNCYFIGLLIGLSHNMWANKSVMIVIGFARSWGVVLLFSNASGSSERVIQERIQGLSFVPLGNIGLSKLIHFSLCESNIIVFYLSGRWTIVIWMGSFFLRDINLICRARVPLRPLCRNLFQNLKKLRNPLWWYLRLYFFKK